MWSEMSVDEKAEAVRSHGGSAAEIAKALGVSRNAVIGVAHRRKNELPGWSPVRMKAHGQKVASARGWRLRDTVAPKAPKPKIVAYKPQPKPEKLPPHQMPARPLMLLQRGQCRWPVNDPERGGIFLFCGCPVIEGPYCSEHSELSHARHLLHR